MTLFFCPHSLHKLSQDNQDYLQFFDRDEKCGPFILHKLIAEGTYGRVFEAFLPQAPEKRFALKLTATSSSQFDLAEMQQEVNILRMLHHRNIVQVYDSFVVPEQKVHVILQEFVRGSDLYYWIAKQEQRYFDSILFPVEAFQERLHIFREIVTVILYLHEKHVFHRDIKLENVLYVEKDKMVKLCDFGLAIYSPTAQDWPQTKVLGSCHYVSPEILKAAEKDNETGQKPSYFGAPAAVWSLGVLFYILVGRVFPFNALTKVGMVDIPALSNIILKGEYKPLQPSTIYDIPLKTGDLVDDLVAKMLQVDVKERMPLLSLLEHPLFQTPLCIQPSLKGFSKRRFSLDTTIVDHMLSTLSTVKPMRTLSCPCIVALDRMPPVTRLNQGIVEITSNLMQNVKEKCSSTLFLNLLALPGTTEHNVYQALKFHHDKIVSLLSFLKWTKVKCKECHQQSKPSTMTDHVEDADIVCGPSSCTIL